MDTCKSKLKYLKPKEKVCPVCGSSHIQDISRITGYLSMDERFGAGKVAEREDRVAHNTDTHEKFYPTKEDKDVKHKDGKAKENNATTKR